MQIVNMIRSSLAGKYARLNGAPFCQNQFTIMQLHPCLDAAFSLLPLCDAENPSKTLITHISIKFSLPVEKCFARKGLDRKDS